MAYPKIIERLFGNGGDGPLLREDIVPEVVSASARRLETPVTLSVSGDASGSVPFDGSADTDVVLTVARAAEADALVLKDVGAKTAPVYFRGGVPVACADFSKTSVASADVASALGTETVGSADGGLWYLRDGVATASDADIGSGTVPVRVEGGRIVASDASVGSATQPVYMRDGEIVACGDLSGASVAKARVSDRLGTATIGSGTVPMFLFDGTPTASESTVGGPSHPVWMKDGSVTALSDSVGSDSVPVWLRNGEIVACDTGHATTADRASDAGHATTADRASDADHADEADHASEADHAATADALGTETVGSPDGALWYLDGGRPVAGTGSVGSAADPVYVRDGVITACAGVAASTAVSATTAERIGSSTVGSAAQPVYIDAGVPVPCAETADSGTGTALDASGHGFFRRTVSGDTAFSFSTEGVPCNVLTLFLTDGGSAAVTWPSSVRWTDGAAPDLTASGLDVLSFVTADGGATWIGSVVAANAL